jgi:hypothetical protein
LQSHTSTYGIAGSVTKPKVKEILKSPVKACRFQRKHVKLDALFRKLCATKKVSLYFISLPYKTRCSIPVILKNKTMSSTFKESFNLNGEDILKKVKELINEGNIRKIIIHDQAGKELMSFPLTIGVVGTLFAPVLAAIGAVAALVGECTITVEREVEKV